MVRRMFGGAGIWSEGLMFALVFDGAIFLKVDAASIPDFEREGSKPFVYTRAKSQGRVGRASLAYWRLPERLYDDPEELAAWARRALAIAERKKFKPQRAEQKKAGAEERKVAVDARMAGAWRSYSGGSSTLSAPECEARFFEVEFAFDAAARLVGDLALLQEPVDVFALGGDQFGAQLRCRRRGLRARPGVARQLPGAMIVAARAGSPAPRRGFRRRRQSSLERGLARPSALRAAP